MTFSDQHHCTSAYSARDSLGPLLGATCACGWADDQHLTLINLLNSYGEHILMATFDAATEIMKVDDVVPTGTVRGAVRLYRLLTGRTGDSGHVAPPAPAPHQPAHYPTTPRRF